MAKVHGVTSAIWERPEGYELAERLAARFTRINDIPVTIIKGTHLPGQYLAHSHFARYHMWNILPPDVEQVIYFDADTIPMRPIPKELPTTDLAAAPELPWLIPQARQFWPIIEYAGTYFNSGVFVAKRSTEKLFEAVLDRQTHAGEGKWPFLYDQTILNIETQVAVKNGELTFSLLSRQWNSQIAKQAEHVQDPYILHFAGVPAQPLGKLRFIGMVMDQLESVGA